jgi:hypothetical protein
MAWQGIQLARSRPGHTRSRQPSAMRSLACADKRHLLSLTASRLRENPATKQPHYHEAHLSKKADFVVAGVYSGASYKHTTL